MGINSVISGIVSNMSLLAADTTSYTQDMISIVSVLSGTIEIGLAMRIIICAIKMSHDEDKMPHKQSIKHCIIAAAVTASIYGIYNILNSYFGFNLPI